jgi:hypothetical protein
MTFDRFKEYGDITSIQLDIVIADGERIEDFFNPFP